jgi:hypothetical protein
MSHVGNGEHDFDGFEELNLPADIKESLRNAKIEARDIIDRLEPFHISSWTDLLMILDDSRETAYRNAEIFSPIHKEMHTKRLKEELKKGQLERLEMSTINMIGKIFVSCIIIFLGLFFLGVLPEFRWTYSGIAIILIIILVISYVRAFFISRRIKKGEIVFNVT